MSSITFPYIPNTESSRKQLTDGQDYIVLYEDCHTGATEAIGAYWDGSHFLYYRSFISSTVKPQFLPSKKGTLQHHHIVGWCRLTQFAKND